jgi:hypothetical protein
MIALAAPLVVAGCIPMATSPAPAAVYFDPDIQSTMDVIGCSSGGCHAEADARMHVVPPALGGSVDANYKEVVPRTNGAAMSLFLTKPVDGAPVMHGGGKLIPMNGATYNQWLSWIQTGAPLRAAGTTAPPAPAPMAPAPDGGAPAPAGDGGATPTACTPPQVTLKQSHYAGQECLTCHANGQNAQLRWTIAGTLFQDTYGTVIRGGATVTVTDARGQVVSMVTDSEGNFYTSQAVSFPITTSASACPSTKAMSEKVLTGSCNSGNCHDTKLPAYLP